MVVWEQIVGKWNDCQWVAGGGVAWMRRRHLQDVICRDVDQGQMVGGMDRK